MLDNVVATLAWMQRRDAQYYERARKGYDPTTGETDMASLQNFAAKRSKDTRIKLGVEDG